ncbi:cell division protein FtsZ [Peribacillus asahii]|uniref:Cell division protein FtsZ n=1 Tax=Peribacillus asahii TaxID=228899 RepID=A0A3Q9RPE8_9BACI|nr:hypothetical protein [Peribacillus asahii]AZV43705.1 cell division protein FtsZ [Peribacillus asahii]
MFACIGIGQGGSMICDKFAEYGIPTAIINYSQSDLSACVHVENKLLLQGSEGVGRDRSLAAEQMSNNYETAISFIKEHFSQPSTELIFIIFSTGGGTGSGITPIISELLMNEMDKTLVLCPIIPDTTESINSQLNSLNTLAEISNLECAIAPIDNQNVFTLGIGKNQLYNAVNSKFVHSIISLIEYTERNTAFGNIDRNDILRLFETKGFLNISHIDISNLSNGVSLEPSYINKAIQESWSNNIFTSPCFDQVIRTGLIFDGQESLMSLIQPKEIFSSFTTQPLDVFEGWYTGEKGKVFTILTGMKFNPTRLQQIKDIVESQSQSIQNVLSADVSIPVSTISFQTKSKTQKKKSLSDILNKYKK